MALKLATIKISKNTVYVLHPKDINKKKIEKLIPTLNDKNGPYFICESTDNSDIKLVLN